MIILSSFGKIIIAHKKFFIKNFYKKLKKIVAYRNVRTPNGALSIKLEKRLAKKFVSLLVCLKFLFLFCLIVYRLSKVFFHQK